MNEVTPPLDCRSPPKRLSALPLPWLVLLLPALRPTAAYAQSGPIQLPIITEVACPIVQWMQGPLAIIIFVCVVAASLLLGMVAKMDWGRIIFVTVILALLVGLGGIISNSSTLSGMLGASACLRSI